jgi:Rps23 Pro-64 3,4-dihydroxylase Tpa1-like proline 4-hydroxylase
MRGRPIYYDPGGVFRWDGPTYPTSTPVDALFDAVRRTALDHPQVAGVEGIDWVALFLTPWLYPVGSALSLHRDGGTYSGSFTFFAHTRWKTHWGGELLLLQEAADPETGAPLSQHGGAGPLWTSEDDGIDIKSLMGIATCVFPRPNRLALIGPDRPHMMSRVDANAGAHVRVSLAGFFLRPP